MLSKEEESQMMKARLDMCEAETQKAQAQKCAEEQQEALYQFQQQPMQPMPLVIPKKVPQYHNHYNVSGTGTFTTTGTVGRLHGPEVAKIVTNHGDGYFSDIRITQEDYIHYKLFRGSWFVKLLYKLGWREPRDAEGCKIQWEAIPGQEVRDRKLEVMLGKTYLKIDELIAEEANIDEHEEFILGIADTDPENLKMIAGLKVLDDGMKAPLDNVAHPPLNGTSQPKSINSGAIALAKTQAAASAWTAGQDANIVMNGHEIVKIDPTGNVSFGDEMTKAISKAVDKAAEETDLLKTGKAP
jgi:hypothetical protein